MKLTEHEPEVSLHSGGLNPPGPVAVKDTLPDGTIGDPLPVSVTDTVQVVAILMIVVWGVQAIAVEELRGRTISVNDPDAEVLLGECTASPWYEALRMVFPSLPGLGS